MRDGGTVPMLEERPLLMLMDGHAMVHRAWHAIRTPLNVSSTGEEVRAVYGFLNTFLRSLGDWNPTHCAIAFDLPGPTFRHRQFREYKAHRPPSPPELRGQFGRIRKLMEAFGVPIFDMDGYEADDILGALCLQSEQQEMEALILTGDTDTLQLVSPWVRVLLGHGVQGRTVYDVPAVRERYGGLGPEAIPDIKALEGDTSDNIPGVPGVGAKTAIRLLTEFGSVEGIYDNLSKIRPPRLQKLLTENRDLALQGKALTTIVRDTPVTLDLEAARFWSYERSAVVDLLRELEFFTVVPRIPFPGADSQIAMDLTGEARDDQVETDYTVVDTESALDEMIDALDTPSGFSFDTETTTLSPTDSDIVGISFSNAPGRAWYVPVRHAEGEQLPLEDVMARTRPLFEGGLPKSAHNANYDLTVLSRHGITVRNLSFDSMLAAHVSGTKSIGLKALALDRLNEEMKQITDLIGTGRKQLTMDRVPISDTADYACADADFTQRLVAVLGDELETKGIRELFDEVEMPLVPVLVRMQLDGVSLDVPMLERLSQGLRDRMARIEARMYETVGHEFNLNSSQQLSDVLFKEFRLPPTKRRQKGFSTDASSLEGLKALIERGEAEGVDPRSPQVLDNILEYRQIAKIKSTYADSLPALVNPRTGRVHTSYNQTGSATGRVSSNDPNVQNIPVRTELGMRVREAFVAENAPEWTLLGRGLLADRAAHPGPHVPGPGPSAGVPQRRGHPRRDGVVRLRRSYRRGDVRYEARREDHELRRAVRPERLRHQPPDRSRPGRGRPVHRDLLRHVSRHSHLRRRDEAAVPGGRVRRDAAGQAALPAGDRLQELPRPRRGRARGHQHAHPGHRRRHHQDRDDPPPGAHRLAGPGVPDDPAGARRTDLRGAAGASWRR